VLTERGTPARFTGSRTRGKRLYGWRVGAPVLRAPGRREPYGTQTGKERGVSYPRSGSLLSALSENWWALLLRGLLAVLFGLIALFLPGMTLTVLVLVFGAYALVEGVFAVVAGIRGVGGAGGC
jgi:Short repeat of unknown function (DUF308)